MSRIGVLPIEIPQGVEVNINQNVISVKGKMGEAKQELKEGISAKTEDNNIIVERPSDQKVHKAMHGLYRALIYNMVFGVSTGYEIILELIGVGYRAKADGQMLELSLGYSHDFHFEIPQEIKVEVITEKRGNPKIKLNSHDKQLIGQVATKIRSLRPPEPYKGKGIRYIDEYVRRKVGKAASV